MYMALLKISDNVGFKPANPITGEVGVSVRQAFIFNEEYLEELKKWADMMTSKGYQCNIVTEVKGSFKTVYSGKTSNRINYNILKVWNDIQIFTTDIFQKSSNEFIIFDTETTGLDIATADAIEIAGIKVRIGVREMQIVDSIDLYINPGYMLPQEIIEFNNKNNTGITQELISSSLDKETAANMLAEFIGGTETLVFHNAEFDLKFIDKLLSYNTVIDRLPVRAYCTLNFSKQIIKGSHRLSNLHAHTPKTNYNLMIKDNSYHNAVSDVYATLDVLQWLLECDRKKKT